MARKQVPTLRLESSVHEASRRIALRWLREAQESLERIFDHDDEEALHDSRVALRKLRATLSVYRAQLRLRKKTRKSLSALVKETSAARDTEVQLTWLESEFEGISEGARTSATWLIEALQKRKDAAYFQLRNGVVQSLRNTLSEVESSLRFYETHHDAFENDGEYFAPFLQAHIHETATKLDDALSRVHSLEDEELAHDARLIAKRLRYLIEPIRDLLPEADSVVRELKALQELLGSLNDLAVRAKELDQALERAAIERARSLAKTMRKTSKIPLDSLQHETGIATILRHVYEEKKQTFGDLLEGYLREGAMQKSKLLAALIDLEKRLVPKEPLEIERKFLLRKVPERALEGELALLDQGYLEGTSVLERVRRKKVGTKEVFTRTVKLGQGTTRFEFEETCSPQMWKTLYSLTQGRRVRKKRYSLQVDELVYEFDVFLDRDLVLLEVELPNEDYDLEFPSWLKPFIEREVTEEKEFTNAALAK